MEEVNPQPNVNTLPKSLIKEYTSDPNILKFVQSKFTKLSKISASKFLKLILENKNNIKYSDFTTKTILNYNKSKFNQKTGYMNYDDVITFRNEFNGFLLSYNKPIPQYTEDKNHGFKVEIRDGRECYIIDDTVSYKKALKLFCDEGGDVVFRYDFDKSNTPISPLNTTNLLQRSKVQIMVTGVCINYPISYQYNCPECGYTDNRKSYEVASTKTKKKCEGVILSNDTGKTKVCNHLLYPNEINSDVKPCYYYVINYDDEFGNKTSADAIGFENYDSGFYDCVLFHVNQPNRKGIFQIVDVKPVTHYDIKLPVLNKNNNYIFDLVKSFDDFIHERTGFNLHGLLPIKIALIFQTIMSYVGMDLIGHVKIIGDKETGKSTVLTYYGFLLNNSLNKSSNGRSISIPALRGTRNSIILLSKEFKFITTGYLGTYKSIHIDEIEDNPELLMDLKSYLYDTNYSYDKAGSDGNNHVRTAHINISGNINNDHLRFYRTTIRKKYDKYIDRIGDEEKPEWEETWDLHLPLYKYTNPYLRTVIKDYRDDMAGRNLSWIDGQDIALFNRFPFYFFVTNEKKGNELLEIVKDNDDSGYISENLELIKALKTSTIIDYFKSLKSFMKSDSDRKNFDTVDKILDEYGVSCGPRTRRIYYLFVKISRMLNHRVDINDDDYNLLKYMLETTKQKVDVADLVDYKVNGPIDLAAEIKKEIELEKSTEIVEHDKLSAKEVNRGIYDYNR